MTGRLDGKRAVVVGAGQTPGETIGNGRATALLFAREGAQVVLVDRDPDSVEETREMIVGEGGAAHVVVADISTEADNVRLVEEATAALGGVDVLHNNVGIGARDASVTRLEEDAYDRIMRVNLKAMWLTCKHVVPVMRDGGGGSIINISSLASIASAGSLVAYKISKAGVNALTQQLAMSSAGRGVRVNAVAPGLMDTPMAIESIAAATGRDRDELRRERDALVPLGRRMGDASDVANAVLYLASDEARFVTGVVLPVDGGQHARVG